LHDKKEAKAMVKLTIEYPDEAEKANELLTQAGIVAERNSAEPTELLVDGESVSEIEDILADNKIAFKFEDQHDDDDDDDLDEDDEDLDEDDNEDED
jgi:hypothetical protein